MARLSWCMTIRNRWPALLAFAAIACGGSPSAPGGDETITGGERFGWDQSAADAGELSTFRYALYVDDARSEASGVSCAPGQTSGPFACTASLPALSSGAHTLQIAAFVIDAGLILESGRSASVRVVKR
jgi:hypothetical protein